MITETTLYGINCDMCGEQYYNEKFDTDEFTCIIAAEHFAESEGWTIKDGKHICPDCYFKLYKEEEQ